MFSKILVASCLILMPAMGLSPMANAEEGGGKKHAAAQGNAIGVITEVKEKGFTLKEDNGEDENYRVGMKASDELKKKVKELCTVGSRVKVTFTEAEGRRVDNVEKAEDKPAAK
jgi:hypothetical protein